MFTSPAMMSDLARTRRRELYAAAAHGHRRRTARTGRTRTVQPAAPASGRKPHRAYAAAK